jgi:hypothetical protein
LLRDLREKELVIREKRTCLGLVLPFQNPAACRPTSEDAYDRRRRIAGEKTCDCARSE